MLSSIIYAMVYLGSALMVFNISKFVQFARFMRGRENWGSESRILYVPVVLLVMFLVGYLVVGVFGNPDLVVAGILFGGSVFVTIMYYVLDHTARRIIESERLEAKLLAAEEGNRAKDAFLASMSHEMRTPMNVILGLDRMALSEPTLPSATRVQLEKIGLSAQHLLGLINNILEMNRMGGDSLEPKYEAFCLHDEVGQMSAMVQTLCEEKGLAFESSLDEGVGDRFVGDAMLLKQALLGILDNAVKYTDAPGTVRLVVAPASAEDCARMQAPPDPAFQVVRFEVHDTGVGMDEDFVPRLFQAFSREDSSSTTSYGGGGLSLAVSKRIVDRMHGDIWATSKKHVGSTFVVCVPLELSDEGGAGAGHADVQNVPDMQGGQDVAPGLEGRRILIAEDIMENAEILADLLELEGAECEHAQNGGQAVSMFEKSEPHHYDAVLMDLRMPQMDGLEATRRIRGMDRDDARTVPIIALTANAFESDVEQSRTAGMDAHLTKPIDADLLYNTLEEHILGGSRRLSLPTA